MSTSKASIIVTSVQITSTGSNEKWRRRRGSHSVNVNMNVLGLGEPEPEWELNGRSPSTAFSSRSNFQIVFALLDPRDVPGHVAIIIAMNSQRLTVVPALLYLGVQPRSKDV
ncbi:hypothetical protein F5146DRAFT_997694 [Armillaria mellea]|nr:hypothetical protein F5146DRAFT_997694 [Armillaria mellea]